MIFHENHLLADDSHEISYFFFFRKLGKISQNLSSAAVVIGVLRVNCTKHSRQQFSTNKIILLTFSKMNHDLSTK